MTIDTIEQVMLENYYYRKYIEVTRQAQALKSFKLGAGTFNTNVPREQLPKDIAEQIRIEYPNLYDYLKNCVGII